MHSRPSDTLNKRYVKTAAGHAEIRSKALSLSRPVRNLLLVINDSQPGAFWLQQIRGLTEADLASLLEAGLLADTGVPAGAPRPARAAAPTPTPAPETEPDTVPSAFEPGGAGDDDTTLWQALQQAIEDSAYSGLYDTLTAQAKGQLGLMKGYRFTLEVERCADLPALRTLARRFAQGLREDRGSAALRPFLDALRTATA